jgi:RNA-directed DNA polymerase
VLTEAGDGENTLTGTPQGGIISPLLAHIALSALNRTHDGAVVLSGQPRQQAMLMRRLTDGLGAAMS